MHDNDYGRILEWERAHHLYVQCIHLVCTLHHCLHHYFLFIQCNSPPSSSLPLSLYTVTSFFIPLQFSRWCAFRVSSFQFSLQSTSSSSSHSFSECSLRGTREEGEGRGGEYEWCYLRWATFLDPILYPTCPVKIPPPMKKEGEGEEKMEEEEKREGCCPVKAGGDDKKDL